MLPRKTGYAFLQGSKQQMVVAGGHCRGKSKGKTERERPASGCYGTLAGLAQGAEYRGKYLREDCGAVGRQSERLSQCQNATG